MPMRRSTLAAFGAAALLAQGAAGMYADDAGKLDWHQENLGRFISAGFDGRGGLTVVGEASTLASLDSRTGELAWRRVLSPDDVIVATSAPSAGRPTATLSSGGRIVRLWSPLDGSLEWETALAPEAASITRQYPENDGQPLGGDGDGVMMPRIVSTEGGHVVVLSAGGIHVLSAVSGAVLAQWWCDPSREPDLASLVGKDVQVTFTSLRPVSAGSLLAGGWTSKTGVSDEAQAFVVAEISPAERLVTFKAAKTTKCAVKPSAGVTLATTTEGSSSSLAVVGVCSSGTSLAVFGPSFESSTVAEAALPAGLLSGTASTVVSSLSDLSGSNGSVLELRGEDGEGSVAVTLSSSKSGGSGAVSVFKGNDESKDAWSCPPASSSGSPKLHGCALAGGMSPSGKSFVSSSSMHTDDNGNTQVVVRVAEVGVGSGSVVTLKGEGMSSLEQDQPARVQAAFLEAGEGVGVPRGGATSDGTRVRFRALVVSEDDSVMMVGDLGVEWVREEAAASVDQVVFVDSTKDELALLAASGQKVEHHIPGWKERMQLRRLEITSYLAGALKSLTGVTLPGSELLDEVDAAHVAFGLKKLAICTTKAGKLYAFDMADGSVVWSVFMPPTDESDRVLLHATRAKGVLGYNPEVAIISIGKASTVVSWVDAITGVEALREEKGFRVTSVVPLDKKDAEDRSLLMLVDGDGGVHAAPNTPDSTAALSDLVPKLFHHNFSEESGLQSFVVVKKVGKSGDVLGSSPVASVPLPTNSKLVAKAYPDRRDAVPTPAHTLGDDSLLIKYINPRMMAAAVLADPVEGAIPGKGQDLTVTVLDNVSGRILHRISHKGAAEPVHMVVSESWVVYTYWSAVSQRTEMSTLSLYEGMIDRYGLSPFNRPEWKEAFSSFESKVPIVLQKTYIFPYPVTALGITVTQRGITAKDILVGTALGQVVLLDRRFLDPRRPVEEPSKSEKEEKLVQYQPFLPVVPTQVLTYYKMVERVDQVLTEPTGLESTSLVLALGLDLFGSRVAPSKTYDMLDPNFNFALLVLVLGAMSAAVVVSSKMAASKRLKDQWT